MNLTPIKMYALKFTRSKIFSPFLDEIDESFLTFLTMCVFRNPIEIYEFDTYYPDHLNLKTENDWETYAEKTRSVIHKVLDDNYGCKKVESSMDD